MNKLTALGGIAVAAVALSLTLAGCGSDTKGEATSSSEKTTSASESTSESSTTQAPTSSTRAAGSQKTIVDYIKENGIVETPIKRGDPGAPTIDLPVPQGWQLIDPPPQDSYGGIVFTDPAAASNPPTIIAIMSKLTGNVDPAKVLEYAPGELQNLPGYDGATEGTAGKLSGFDATQLGGTFNSESGPRMIAQKTVVIPGQDGLFVLQLNASGTEDQMGPLMDATTTIDDQTKITP